MGAPLTPDHTHRFWGPHTSIIQFFLLSSSALSLCCCSSRGIKTVFLLLLLGAAFLLSSHMHVYILFVLLPLGWSTYLGVNFSMSSKDGLPVECWGFWQTSFEILFPRKPFPNKQRHQQWEFWKVVQKRRLVKVKCLHNVGRTEAVRLLDGEGAPLTAQQCNKNKVLRIALQLPFLLQLFCWLL